jgi:hypothetical protein
VARQLWVYAADLLAPSHDNDNNDDETTTTAAM